MKKLLIITFYLFLFFESFAQSNNEIAGVYIKRANASLNNLDIDIAKDYFEKAIDKMDSINNHEVARLGTFIYFELKNFKEAKRFASYYFDLVKVKKSEEYNEMLSLSVDIEEFYEEELKENQRLEEERILREKELKKIDSLKTIWKNKSDLLSLKYDSIYQFNAYNVAFFKNKGFYGLLNDVGNTLVEANEYVDAIEFDGFFIFKNKIEEPTKLFCFNSKENTGFLIPSASEFNTLSTNYGKVLLPRGNGKLVCYPNNSVEVFVFDLNVRKIVKISNQEEVLKNLKKLDFIDKYDKNGEIKISKDKYFFGGHLGGGIHPIYAEKGYVLEGFLFGIDGRFIKRNTGFDFVGYFYNNTAQAIKGSQTFWINQNGTKIGDAKNEAEKYLGKTRLTKSENGAYQLISEDGFIILGNNTLEKMENFLRSFSGN